MNETEKSTSHFLDQSLEDSEEIVAIKKERDQPF